MNARERVETAISRWRAVGLAPFSADEIAADLCDEDVAAGDYEGCSTELELAYTEYETAARETLDRFCPECGADVVGNDPHEPACARGEGV